MQNLVSKRNHSIPNEVHMIKAMWNPYSSAVINQYTHEVLDFFWLLVKNLGGVMLDALRNLPESCDTNFKDI